MGVGLGLGPPPSSLVSIGVLYRASKISPQVRQLDLDSSLGVGSKAH